MEILTKNWN